MVTGIWSAVHYLWIGSCNYHLYEREFFKLQNYLLMQLAAIALSILDVVLHFTGYLHHIVLAWIAFGLSVLLWSGTMIIGDRKAKNELKRKLHI